MIKIGDLYYYIDLEAMSKQLELDDDKSGVIIEKESVYTKDDTGQVLNLVETITEKHKPKEVDGFKYEVIRTMLEIVLSETLEFNQSTMKMVPLEQASSNFIMAFNTLTKLKIIQAI